MKVAETQTRSIEITELDGLDPIRVHLENIAPGKGRITLECYGQSWTSSWPAMGKDHTIESFFCSCENGYLVGCLAPALDIEIRDDDALADKTRRKILELRATKCLSRQRARELWDDCAYIPDGPLWCDATLTAVYGDDFWTWLEIPQKANPDYHYLCRIIDAAKAAIDQSQPKITQAA